MSELSVVDALAEALRFGHWPYSFQTDDPERRGEIACGCGWEHSGRDDDLTDWADHIAAAVVAVVRSWPAGLQAELLDGEVEQATKTRWDDGSGSTFWDAAEAEEYAAKASTWGNGRVTFHSVERAITSWRPVEVAHD